MSRDSFGTQVPDGSVCSSTGKRMWASRKRARRVARQVNPGEHMSAYHCPACRQWHLGHMPPTVIAGDLDRAELPISRRRASR